MKHKSPQFPAAYDPVRSDIARVLEMIAGQIKSADMSIAPVMQHVMESPGSLIRPVLVLLAGKSLGRLQASHVRIAAIVEMIHTATLLHDDVIDQARLRRGRASLNSIWGNDCAVLAGDFLLARAFGIAGDLNNAQVSRTLADAAVAMCRGELRQNLLRGKWDIDERTYRGIIEDKTAKLISASCALGAIASNASGTAVRRFAGFGLNLGMAFQHTDDLLDIVGSESLMRKRQGSDIANGKLTLAFIVMLQRLGARAKASAFRELKSGRCSTGDCLDDLRRTGALQHVFDRAGAYIDRSLGCLQADDQSPAHTGLRAIARSVIDRIDTRKLR